MIDRPPTPADDEALSALLDDELGERDAALLRARLETEPALAARLAELERADTAAKSAYASVVDEPLPRGVLDLLRDTRAEDVAPNVVRSSARGTNRRPAPQLPWALAASIALGIGIAIGIGVARSGGENSANLLTSSVAHGSALEDVLQRTPSGTTRKVADDFDATPRLSFATTGGDYCRQLDLAGPRGTTAAVACRRGDGWQIEVAAFTVRDRPNSGVYRPAAAPSAAVDDTVDALIAGDPLEPAAEAELIARGWSNRER